MFVQTDAFSPTWLASVVTGMLECSVPMSGSWNAVLGFQFDSWHRAYALFGCFDTTGPENRQSSPYKGLASAFPLACMVHNASVSMARWWLFSDTGIGCWLPAAWPVVCLQLITWIGWECTVAIHNATWCELLDGQEQSSIFSHLTLSL